ncbi:MAG: molybdenum ABC transporter permease [Acidobacteriota bacterium]
MDDALLAIVLRTVQIAGAATLLTAPPAIALGYGLARSGPFPGKRLVSALIGLPLVVPPTAVGFLLLRLLAHDGPLGAGRLGVDLGLLLSWRGAALAAAVMSMPLVARTARVAFEGVDPRLERVARTLGYGPIETFVRVTLPLAGRGLAAALVLGFTRAVGEFGATVTVAGTIPGQTQTLASAIYRAQQTGDAARADALVIWALLLGLVAIVVAERLADGRERRA